MSGDRTSLSAVKLALMAREARVHAQAHINADPIAIVGMACRAPGGADTPDALWRLLRTGVDATSEVPADRWDAARWFHPDPSAPGKSMTRRGAFLDQIDAFDAKYFGILPREAELMDPQQRLALEVAIEAIDDAGVVHGTLGASRAGVFLASYHDDYARLVYDDVDAIDLRTLTGTLQSVVSNRISHFLDLRGPSITIDTACSSSLVAVHLACQSLRLGECDFALAGGVSVIISPELMVSMSKVGFMAPDGRCKTFDARADGFGRGEGCGMIALKRLADALADGDRVIAVIRGSAVNQDGRSTVLTAPNGVAQEALVREALASAAIAPERVVYIEAHGTGTELGDPIEVDALTAALSSPACPVRYIGSIKANIGHLEAAAGVIGLIKAALVLRHGEVPPQPDFGAVSPHLDLSAARLKVATSPTPLPMNTSSPPCAAVSAFGVGGTNAHVLLERAPHSSAKAPAPEAARLLPLSARTVDGLRALEERWLGLLGAGDAPAVEDLCHSASCRRTHYPVRRAVVGRSRAELRLRLEQALRSEMARGDGPPRIGFVYSGQGPQWWGMGGELRANEPVFAGALADCDEAIRRHAGWSVIEELSRSEQTTRLGETAIAQPALFALQVALTALWRKWGITANAVTGHSVGEIAAFHAAGALTLDEAARLVCLRGASMQAATGGGRMAAAAMTEREARALADRLEGLDLAAVNAPRSVVLSGEAAALDAALAQLAGRGVHAQTLPVDYAFHGRQMAPLSERFARELGRLGWRTPERAVYSTLTGAAVPKEGFTAADVARAVREPVRFADAIAAMARDGVDAFVEIGPHPVLAVAIAETLDAAPPRVLAASLRRGRAEIETMREACAQLYSAGVDPDWNAVQPAGGAIVSLPPYPWRRQRHWVKQRERTPAAHVTGEADWLGPPIPIAGQDITVFRLDPRQAGWLDHHHVLGRRIAPAAAMMQAMNAAARVAMGRAVALRSFEIAAPLTVPDTPALAQWQVMVSGNGRVTLEAGERPEVGGPLAWRRIAEAEAAPLGLALEVPATPGEAIDIDAFYARFAQLGANFGPSFRLLSDVVAGGDGASGTAALGGACAGGVHPALVDAGVQLVSVALGRLDALHLPLSADAVEVSDALPRRLRVRARIKSTTERTITADIIGIGAAGETVFSIAGLRLVRATAASLTSGDAAQVFVTRWVPMAAADVSAVPLGRCAVLDSGWARTSGFAKAAAARGIAVREVASPRDAETCEMVVVFADAVPQAFDLAALVNCIPEDGKRSLVILTQNAVAAGVGESAGYVGAALWGLAGVAALERPDLHIRLVDLDYAAATNGARTLDVLERCAEARVAVRDGRLRVPRLQRAPPRAAARRVAIDGAGLECVTVGAFEPPMPGPGEVRIRVAASGVNFRDALLALGMYAGAAPLGAECAGVVDAVGPGVAQFRPGERVFGLVPACHASHAIARADLIARTPDALSDVQAAALPVAYLTADIGLRTLAGLKRGERVLIHAAAGGVGLAAVALAQRIGAEIHATAGSPEKRRLLAERGVAHVYDSRTLDYGDQILEATRGEGVRVALSSLTGEFVGATLRALARNGVLLELGKREVWTPDEVAAVRPDVRYHVYDSGQMAAADPSLFAAFASDVAPAIAAGCLPAPPIATWPLSRASDAFRHMAQARHTGKLVLVPDADRPMIRADASYLITGGLGGLGRLTCAWLASRGARHIILVGRSAPDVETRAAIAAIANRGVQIHAAMADAADARAMRSIIEAAAARGAPVRGVVHAAGVAADATLRNATEEDFAAAWQGKVEGARVLIEAAGGLDFALLYSAAGLVFGAPGQGAYAAANAALDALAADWCSLGVRVFGIAWGAWAEAGMFARLPERLQAEWTRRGLVPMTGARAFAALEQLMAQEAPCGVIADVDWPRVFTHAPAGLSLAPFETFASRAAAKVGPAPENDEIAYLRALPQARRMAALKRLTGERVRAVIGVAADVHLPEDAPLKDAGLDSLMAIELRNTLARLGGVPLAATLAFDYPSINAIAGALVSAWLLADVAKATPPIATADVGSLSEDAAEDLLEAELHTLAAARRM